MEVIIQIIKQLPPIAPRLAVLIVLIVLVALPQTRRVLTRTSMIQDGERPERGGGRRQPAASIPAMAERHLSRSVSPAA